MKLFNLFNTKEEQNEKTKFINNYKPIIENHFENFVQETIKEFKQMSGSGSLLNSNAKKDFILDCVQQCATHFYNDARKNKDLLNQTGLSEEEMKAIINQVGNKVLKKYL